MAARDWFPTFYRLAKVRPSARVPFAGWWPPYTTENQQRSLLRLLALAVEENLDVVPLLEAWASDERGLQRRRLHRLLELLEKGRSLPAALEEVPGVVGDEGLLAFRFDAQLGMRAAAVRQELSDTARTNARSKGRRAFIYFCVLILLGLPVVAYLQMGVFPRLNKIFAAFDVPPTEAMNRWAAFAEVAGNFWWLILLGVLASLFVALFKSGRRIRAMFSRFWPGRATHPLSADVLHKVALALQAGRPIPSILSTLARYYFDPTTRQQLLFVRNEVEQGVDPWHSLVDVHFLTAPELQLLKSAGRMGNQPLVLQFIAQAKKRRYLQWQERSGELLLPALVLLLGGFILFLALAYFGPLVQLILALDQPSL